MKITKHNSCSRNQIKISQTSHSSQAHLGSIFKMLKPFPNFCYQFLSTKGISPESLSPIPFLLQFLEAF